MTLLVISFILSGALVHLAYASMGSLKRVLIRMCRVMLRQWSPADMVVVEPHGTPVVEGRAGTAAERLQLRTIREVMEARCRIYADRRAIYTWLYYSTRTVIAVGLAVLPFCVGSIAIAGTVSFSVVVSAAIDRAVRPRSLRGCASRAEGAVRSLLNSNLQETTLVQRFDSINEAYIKCIDDGLVDIELPIDVKAPGDSRT